MTLLPRPLHEAHGATWQGEGDGVRNYGDPATEYRSARETAIVVERRDVVLLRAWGRDPLKMLQGLLTNDLVGAGDDRVVYAAALTPKGKMVADMHVLRQGAELLLRVHGGAEAALLDHFRKFVPPLFARFERADLCALGLYGPGAGALLAELLSTDVPAAPGDVVRARMDNHDVVVYATSEFDVPAWELWLQPEPAATLWQRLTKRGAVPAGESTLDVLRVEAGTPAWGRELDDTTIPLEAGLRHRAISETKGCYTGQEVIIRILHRGHVNRHLRRLHFGDGGTPAAGAELRNADGKPVGRVTSAVWSPQAGEVLGMGYVRREVEPGSSLSLEHGGTVRVEVLP